VKESLPAQIIPEERTEHPSFLGYRFGNI